MPLRFAPPPLAATRFQRFFHNTSRRQSYPPNHYETLQIPVNATPAEVKKSFYHLSKTHHPDRNPDDPNASDRFVRISDAYAVLGHPSKRQAYDREHIRSSSVHSHSSPRPTGSYHSTHNPAGGRSPSGLSRRRSQFRGPPPSFYRSGGWGSHSEKRRSAQQGAEPRDTSDSPSYTGSGTTGGMGPGQAPLGYGDHNDVPHFDRERHFRTHEDMRRRREKQGEGWNAVGEELPMGMLGNFLWVGSVLALGVAIPVWIFERKAKQREARRRDKDK